MCNNDSTHMKIIDIYFIYEIKLKVENMEYISVLNVINFFAIYINSIFKKAYLNFQGRSFNVIGTNIFSVFYW